MKTTMTLAENHVWRSAPRLAGARIGEGSQFADHETYEVEIYRAKSGRITVRCYVWHAEQDVSREGYLLDRRVSGADLVTAEQRARDCGFPLVALLAAISQAEETTE